MPEDPAGPTLPSTRPAAAVNWPLAALLLGLLTLLLVLYFGPAEIRLTPVGSSYWPMPAAIRLYVNFTPGATTALFVGYLLVATLIGTMALLCCLEWRRGPMPDGLLGLLSLTGFFPGYLILIGVNRGVTLLLPNAQAHALMPWIYLLLAGALALACRRPLAELRWPPLFAGGVVGLMLFAALLVLQLQPNNGVHVLGDGLKRFLPLLLGGEGLQAGAHFPVFLQHYDEVMFVYPLLAPDGRDGSFVELYWLLYAFGKAAALLLVAAVVRVLAGSVVPAVLVAFGLGFGALHLFAGRSLLLFDSGNPLWQNLHVGRVLLAVLPLALLGLGWSGAVRLRGRDRMALPLLVMAGLGAAALSSSVLVLLLTVLAVLACRGLELPADAARRGLTILFVALAIGYSGLQSDLIAWLFLAGIVCAIGVMLRPFAGVRVPPLPALWSNADFRGLAALLAGLGLGLALAGNSMAAALLKLLGLDQLRPVLPAMHQIPPFRIGSNPGCSLDVLNHCDSLATFVEHFGLVLGLPILALYLLWPRANGPANAARAPAVAPLPPLARLIAACLLCLALGFFGYDFTNAGAEKWLPTWLKSRLIEPWVYALLAFAIVGIWQAGCRRARLALLLLTGWQVLAVLLVTNPPIHRLFLRNLSYLLAVGG